MLLREGDQQRCERRSEPPSSDRSSLQWLWCSCGCAVVLVSTKTVLGPSEACVQLSPWFWASETDTWRCNVVRYSLRCAAQHGVARVIVAYFEPDLPPCGSLHALRVEGVEEDGLGEGSVRCGVEVLSWDVVNVTVWCEACVDVKVRVRLCHPV
eukprot:2555486-Amphidinium_carterae.1